MFRAKPARRQFPSSKKSKSKRTGLWRVVDIVLIVAAVAALGYGAYWLIELNRGYSMTKPLPVYAIRLQLQDASGDTTGLADSIGRVLDGTVDSLFALEVVETSRFELRQVPHSFILSREEDRTAACLLAERLGLDPGAVKYKPLPGNTSHITTTLVLGADKGLVAERLLTKEN